MIDHTTAATGPHRGAAADRAPGTPPHPGPGRRAGGRLRLHRVAGLQRRGAGVRGDAGAGAGRRRAAAATRAPTRAVDPCGRAAPGSSASSWRSGCSTRSATRSASPSWTASPRRPRPAGRGLLLLTDVGASADALRTAPMDGVILLGCSDLVRRTVDVVLRRGIPVVALGGPPIDGVLGISLDDAEATVVAARHLADLGHRSVAVVALPLDYSGPSAARSTPARERDEHRAGHARPAARRPLRVPRLPRRRRRRQPGERGHHRRARAAGRPGAPARPPSSRRATCSPPA